MPGSDIQYRPDAHIGRTIEKCAGPYDERRPVLGYLPPSLAG